MPLPRLSKPPITTFYFKIIIIILKTRTSLLFLGWPIGGNLTNIHVTFSAGDTGAWRIDNITPVTGSSLAGAQYLNIHEGRAPHLPDGSGWTLRGVTSNMRYTQRSEMDILSVNQQPLHRPMATRAALIPIRKTESWWALPQDERRSIFEEQSRHITIGLDYLPGVARRLHHCRELGEPFDFLTWFEYAPEHSDHFEEMVDRLRHTPEWKFVDREVDIRLSLL